MYFFDQKGLGSGANPLKRKTTKALSGLVTIKPFSSILDHLELIRQRYPMGGSVDVEMDQQVGSMDLDVRAL